MKRKFKGAKDAAPQNGKEKPWTEEDRNNYARLRFEEEYGCVIFNFENLNLKDKILNDFIKKLKSIVRYSNLSTQVLFFRFLENSSRFGAQFYTSDYSYRISVKTSSNKEDTYLGCTVSCRKPRPGELWTRGSDLPDGKYNEKTWNDILCAIIANEIKTLQMN